MNDRFSDRHAILAALGHSSRFRLALCLLDGDRCVGELAGAIGLSQSCTTRHVQALERAGVVRSRRDGKRVLVAIERGTSDIAELVGWLAPEVGAPRAPRGRPGPVRGSRTPEPAAARRARSARRAAVEEAAPEPARAKELAPSEAPVSGTYPAPSEAQPPRPRRPRETIEDFLL